MMKERMLKMLEDKFKKSDMSPEEKDAKKSVLGDLVKEMNGMVANSIKGLKKVTVAAKDNEGLKEGLEKAEDMVEKKDDVMSEKSCPMCEGNGCEECPKEDVKEMESSEESEMSPEEIDMMIAELQSKKEKLMK